MRDISLSAWAEKVKRCITVSPLQRPLIQLLFSFNGRIPRSTWWVASLANSVFLTAASYLFSLTEDPAPAIDSAYALPLLLLLFVGMWIALALNAKRWHDMSEPAWLGLLTLVPLVGGLTLIWYGFVKGTGARNSYGADPLASDEAQPRTPPVEPVAVPGLKL
jgi:uncharacterized membrane protein YhaH (DUF805 family)